MKPSGAHYIQEEGESWICSSLREGYGGILLLSTATSWEDLKKTNSSRRDAVAEWEAADKS